MEQKSSCNPFSTGDAWANLPLDVVMFQPEIPQNTGNVGRTCVALGCKLWLVRPLGFRLDEQRLRRAGLDYWEHLTWQAVADWAELQSQLDGRRMWLFTKWGTKSYDQVQYQADDVLVFGSESSGLPTAIREAHPEHCVRIPMSPHVRSLNLSNSVAIATYEARRQLQFDRPHAS